MKVFITGTFRAGTTLASQVLSQHPRLSITYDSVHFMRYAWQRYGRDTLTPDAARQMLGDMHERLESRFGRGLDVAALQDAVDGLADVRYSALYDLIMRDYCGGAEWGEKTVLQWRNVGDLFDMFDDMVVVHCLRDPRDVLCSWRRETIAPGNDYLDAIGNCYDSMLYAGYNAERYAGRYYVLRFESMVAAPEQVVREMCAALGLDFVPEMLDVERFRNKVTQERWQPNTSFRQEIEGISQAPVGRWAEHIDAEDLVLCEIVNRAQMAAHGYELSGRLADLDLALYHSAWQKLSSSALAMNGVLNVLQTGEGVQRNPLSENDPSTWEKNVDKL